MNPPRIITMQMMPAQAQYGTMSIISISPASINKMPANFPLGPQQRATRILAMKIASL